MTVIIGGLAETEGKWLALRSPCGRKFGNSHRLHRNSELYLSAARAYHRIDGIGLEWGVGCARSLWLKSRNNRFVVAKLSPGDAAMSRVNRINGIPPAQGLYDPAQEHDACGIGFVASIRGEKSHDILRDGIQVLLNLAHRGACGCDAETGDGAGVLIQIPHKFYARECAKIGIRTTAAWFLRRGNDVSAGGKTSAVAVRRHSGAHCSRGGFVCSRLERHAGLSLRRLDAWRELRSRTFSRFLSDGHRVLMKMLSSASCTWCASARRMKSANPAMKTPAFLHSFTFLPNRRLQRTGAGFTADEFLS